MLAWNRLSRTKKLVRLETLSRGPLVGIAVVSQFLGLLGILLLINATFDFAESIISGPVGGVLSVPLLFLASALYSLQSLLRNVSMRYDFDLEDRVLKIGDTPQKYDFLPTQFAFSDIECLRLVFVDSPKALVKIHLELVLDDGKFYPVTAFKDEKKARRIARELQGILNVAVKEDSCDRQFREYKTAFLRQFNPAYQEQEEAKAERF